jgi:hypothetical protein
VSTALGFDTVRYNQNLLLALPFREGTGAMTRDWAKPYHPMTLVGTPTWTHLANDLTVLDFGNLDEITCPGADSADLDFTSTDFSLAAWAYHDDVGSAHVICNRAQLNTCGWEWYTAVNNLALRTNQAGSREGASAVGCIVTGQWQFLAVTRDGLVGQMYVDGERWQTMHSDNGLLDPVACGVQTFRVANNPNANYFDGKLWNLRIWDRKLTAVEVAAMYAAERDLFGV